MNEQTNLRLSNGPNYKLSISYNCSYLYTALGQTRQKACDDFGGLLTLLSCAANQRLQGAMLTK